MESPAQVCILIVPVVLRSRQRFFPAPNCQAALFPRGPGAGRGNPAPGAAARGCRTGSKRGALPSLGDVFEGLQGDLLVLEAAPQLFDEDVVAEPTAPL